MYPKMKTREVRNLLRGTWLMQMGGQAANADPVTEALGYLPIARLPPMC